MSKKKSKQPAKPTWDSKVTEKFLPFPDPVKPLAAAPAGGTAAQAKAALDARTAVGPPPSAAGSK